MFAFLPQLIEECGFVFWPLAACSLILWYAVGTRIFVLRRQVPRSYLKPNVVLTKSLDSQSLSLGTSPYAVAWGDLFATWQRGIYDQLTMDDILKKVSRRMQEGASLTMAVVTIAPLLGLLGTVVGMIETFDSMAEMSLFTQSGGIAQGVAQALTTTQVGLIIAVPGMILANLLNKAEQARNAELTQLAERLFANHGESHAS